MKTYTQAITYLESFIHYEKTPPRRGGKETFDLAGFRRLLSQLGNPHRRFRVIHVAGTKGKGSTCAMAAGILRAQGLKTGLYTSPHLISYRERIQIDGQWISEKRFMRQIQRVREAIERGSGFRLRLQPLPRRPLRGARLGRCSGGACAAPPASSEFRTTFEILTAAAFLEFAEQAVDIAVIETGLGGTLDATNVVEPDVAVLTSISLDHTQILGNSITRIAKDKSGILKSNCMAVIGPQPPAAKKVIQQLCARKKIKALWHGKDWRISNVSTDIKGTTWDLTFDGQTWKNLHCPLPGSHQAENGCLAVMIAIAGYSFSGTGGPAAPAAAVRLRSRRSKSPATVAMAGEPSFERLREPPEKEHPALAIRQGLKKVQWPGRFHAWKHNVILDGAHNPESARRLVQTFREIFPKQKCVLILGVSMDKDFRGMLRHLRKITSTIIATEADTERAMPIGELARICADMHKGQVFESENVSAALDLAGKHAGRRGKILVTGSLFLIGDFLLSAQDAA